MSKERKEIPDITELLKKSDNNSLEELNKILKTDVFKMKYPYHDSYREFNMINNPIPLGYSDSLINEIL